MYDILLEVDKEYKLLEPGDEDFEELYKKYEEGKPDNNQDITENKGVFKCSLDIIYM